MLTLIAARDRNGAIGKDNTIPWRAPEDLAFFQRETRGGALIMGRNTWDSLPVKPLKGRLNIVVSASQTDLGEVCCSSLEAALDTAYAEGYRRVYGVGGQRIYQELLPLAQRLLVTEVDAAVDGADTFFPSFDRADWACLGQTELRPSGPQCTAFEYVRRTIS